MSNHIINAMVISTTETSLSQLVWFSNLLATDKKALFKQGEAHIINFQGLNQWLEPYGCKW